MDPDVDDHGAAHSMDTDWYVVDAAGHVARCHSGEEGAVPWAAHSQSWTELGQDLQWIAHVGELPLTGPRKIIWGSRGVEGNLAQLPEPTWDGVIVFQHRELADMFHDDYYRGYPVPKPWTPLPDVITTAGLDLGQLLAELTPSELVHWDRALTHAPGVEAALEAVGVAPLAVRARDILTCGFVEYWNAKAILGAVVLEWPDDPSRLGLYDYGCGFRGPYWRSHVPTRPLSVDELPDELRRQLELLRVKFRFASTERIDPEALGDCNTWGS